MLSQASSEEIRKLVYSDSNSSVTKRDFDAVEKENKTEGPSKKTIEVALFLFFLFSIY
jgi:hypothetical protein